MMAIINPSPATWKLIFKLAFPLPPPPDFGAGFDWIGLGAVDAI